MDLNKLKPEDFEPTDEWLDIGGHIGTFCCRYGDKVSSIYSYEPHPPTFDILQMNISENNLDNKISAFNLGITGKRETKAHLSVAKRSFHCNTMVKQVRGRDTMEIDLVNINDVFENHPNVNKVKMDGEGIEYDVIMNCKFPKKVSYILYEYHQKLLDDESCVKYKEMIEELKNQGFIIDAPEPKIFWGGVCMVVAKR